VAPKSPELTSLWLQADSATRQAITGAAHIIDQELSTNAQELGESRGDEDRIFFVYPLGIEFELDDQGRMVRVFHVWGIRRK